MDYFQMQSVIVSFWYGKENWDPIYELEERLRTLCDEKEVGIFDGHEINMDDTDGYFFLYGPSAEELFKTVKPILAEIDFMKTATALLSFGHHKECDYIVVPVVE